MGIDTLGKQVISMQCIGSSESLKVLMGRKTASVKGALHEYTTDCNWQGCSPLIHPVNIRTEHTQWNGGTVEHRRY